MNDGLIAIAIRRPVSILVGVVLVVLFGSLSLVRLPIQLTPDIAIPSLTVTTRWSGAAPQEVEREILEEQEEVLKSVQGLDRMTSEASSGQGSVTLEFEVGTEIGEALVRVTNRLSQVPRYPENADQPVVTTADSAGPPLAVILLQADDGSDVGQYRTWVGETLLPRLERIDGVAGARFFGGRETEVVVAFDPTALASRGVGVGQLAAAIRSELRDVSGGDIDMGKRRYVVRTLAAPREISDLEDLVLAVDDDGRPVSLGDVAKVSEGLRERTAYVMGDTHESMAFLFSREAGSNVLEVTDEIHRVVAELNEEYLADMGLHLRVAADQTAYIRGALRLVRNNLVLGGALAVMVLVIFLRSVPAASVVGTAIPVCVIGTALGMSLLGRTVNVVSLAGLAFAVGMVVDNAIVVLENIDTWRRRGVDAHTASLEGTREVWGAILASTLTTAAVFVPIITWSTEVGELLRDVAVAMTVAVFLSLVVSVLAVPSFAARVLKPVPPTEVPSLPVRLAARARDLIGALVTWLCSSILRAGAVGGGLVATSMLLALILMPPLEYLPTGHRNLLFGILIPPPGYSVPEIMKIGRSFQDQLEEHRGVDVDGVPAVKRSFFVARPAAAFMGASTEDPRRIGELVQYYRTLQAQVPGTFGIATQASLFGRSIGSGRAVEVEITGPRLDQLVGLGGRMMGSLRQAMPDAQIRPVPSLDLGAPEMRLTPNRREATRHGMTGAQIGATVDALVDGWQVGEFAPEGQPQLDVVLRPSTGGATDGSSLLASPVATPRGDVVPLGTLVHLTESVGPTSIRRVERARSIALQVSPSREMALERAMELIEAEVVEPLRAQGAIPPDVRVQLAGTADKLQDAKYRMGATLLMALVISFLLLAALFEDFVAPVAILVAVPFAAVGGLAGLRFVDLVLGTQPLDMMTAMGFVILIGVVVNNAILVVDGALTRLRGGTVLAEALGQSVSARVRPIFMSTLTSLAGLAPLVIFPGSGSELYRGVGAVVLGGLAFSTLLTLVAVPAVFAVLWRIRSVVWKAT